ncbi:MAG: UDP-N-acetylglucosamine 2-epimerase (non-hydrolyzing) [Ginsengibacter sp.]
MKETINTIYIIVGTRPNFIKITRFKEVAKQHKNIKVKIIHTGQHFDHKMSSIFFQQFNIEPDHIIELSASSPSTQIAEIMVRLEEIFLIDKPGLVMVVGDVNSTLAGALVANKMGLLLAHLESGLRSYDTTMPEEWNRILTDKMADHMFVTEQSGVDNLLIEKKHPDQIHLVGNTMIDTMLAFDNDIDDSNIMQELRLTQKNFILVTIHRPATVDNKEGLRKLIQVINNLPVNYKVVFPVHPRTLKNIARFGLEHEIDSLNQLIITEPLDYFSFQKLIKECKFIITDSGGIQEESTLRNVPCLTLRPNTERPVTVTLGTNTLVPFDPEIIMKYVTDIENNNYKKGQIPSLWDGKATERIMAFLSKFFLEV